MNANFLSPSPSTPENADYSLPLVDSMDSAIGETASVMGAMMTEVLRRALRGGVKQLGEELQTYAQNRVDATLVDRMPALEERVTEVADHSARTAATEVATEEVRALEVRTREANQALSGRIDQTEETTAARARELAAEIERTERQSRQATQETAEQLSGKIEEASKRVEETFQAELDKQVAELLHRSRKGTSALRSRLLAMQETAERLLKQIHDEQSERRAEQGVLRGELEREGRERRDAEKRLRSELTEKLAERQALLEEELAQLRQTNQKLRGRIEELEKPRGLRALFAWLFGRRKKKHAEPEEDEED
jgi:chromosome segregation ATPase